MPNKSMLAARQDDRVFGMDSHMVWVPSGASEVPALLKCLFRGKVDGSLSPSVWISGKQAAVVGSTATIEHTPPPGTRFQEPAPKNQGTVRTGSATVWINGKAAARAGTKVLACDDSPEPPTGAVGGSGNVRIG